MGETIKSTSKEYPSATTRQGKSVEFSVRLDVNLQRSDDATIKSTLSIFTGEE